MESQKKIEPRSGVAPKTIADPVDVEKNNNSGGMLVVLFAIFAILGFVFGGLELYENIQIKNENDLLKEKLLAQNVVVDTEDCECEEEITVEDECKTKINEWPEFYNDYFMEAMFIYSWFTDNKTLSEYSDSNPEYQDYRVLNLDGIKTIDEMRQRAYKIFDKDFIDVKFDEVISSDLIKQGNNVVLVRDGAVGLLNQYDGYDYHNVKILDDGSYLYTVHFEDLSDDLIYHGCSGGDYDFIYELNPDGTHSFKEFSSLAELCSVTERNL